MANQKLQQKTQQNLSPQQIQLMHILSLPITELEQQMEKMVEENIALEEVAGAEDELLLSESHDDQEDDGLDEAFEDPERDDDDTSFRERRERDDQQDSPETRLTEEQSLYDNLIEQLSMLPLGAKQLAIAKTLVGSLDGAGYLTRHLRMIENDLAFQQDIEATEQEVEEALRLVQSLEPAGVGARNLQECLLLQLKAIRPKDLAIRCATEIVQDCFDELSKHHYDKIMERLQIDEDLFHEAQAVITSLDPKPGGGDGDSRLVALVQTDFILERDEFGHFSLILNEGNLPKIQLSEDIVDQVARQKNKNQMSAEESASLKFYQNSLDSASAFIAALEDRKRTLYKIMKAIVAAQQKFFTTGDPADLKPLLQKDIAAMTGFDDSTVSRVVNSKYVQTEFGPIALKSCFSQSMSTGDGDDVATEAIRQELKKLVDSEDKREPFSDQAITELLNQKGFPLSRRTVAKYREMMGIASSRLRKSLKILLLCIMLVGCVLQAQEPMSYFDSIIYARTHQSKPATKSDKKKQKDSPSKNSHSQSQARTPIRGTIDTALSNGDEMIERVYNSTLTAPSLLWYGNNFSDRLVRLRALSMDSLPDEVNIRLLKTGEEFCFPVKNIITSPYGWRWNRPHRGVDVRLSVGEPVHSAFNGVVRIARPMGAYGNLVVVRHYNGLETVYGHLSKIQVKPMQIVKAGDVIGLGGSTGRSTGPHLHFEVRFQYEPFDPEWILDFSNYTLRTRKLYLDKTYFGIRKPRSSDDLVYKADKSIVPEEQERERKAPSQIFYTIRDGDRLDALAKKYRTSIESIKELNPEVKKYRPGVKIRVR